MHHVTNKELVSAIRLRIDFLQDAVRRVVQLYNENEELKAKVESLSTELRSRRRQGDVWRKKFNQLTKEKSWQSKRKSLMRNVEPIRR